MVAIEVGLVVLYRIHFKLKIFPNNAAMQIIVGDGNPLNFC